VFVTQVACLLQMPSTHLLKIMVVLKLLTIWSPKTSKQTNQPTKQKSNKIQEFILASCYIFLQETECMSQILIGINHLPISRNDKQRSTSWI